MTFNEQIIHKINYKTKPLGALGQLEDLAHQICKVQNTLSPCLLNPTIFLFAADHGIANEGVSAYPQEVTWQMVMNILGQGAGVNVFANQHKIALKVVDAGVNKEFGKVDGLIDKKVGMGTKSFLREKAMTRQEMIQCISNGKNLINEYLKNTECNILGFGEMGIANTSSASMLMHFFTDIPLEMCVGKGTGLDEQQLLRKLDVLEKSKALHALAKDDVEVILQTFGGFEILTMLGAMLESFAQNKLIMIDGFIASAAFLGALKLNPSILENAIFCHQSNECGHALVLNYLNVKPLLKLDLRLGEGSGCALAYSLIESAVNMMNNMASFEDAQVSNKSE